MKKRAALEQILADAHRAIALLDRPDADARLVKLVDRIGTQASRALGILRLTRADARA